MTPAAVRNRNGRTRRERAITSYIDMCHHGLTTANAFSSRCSENSPTAIEPLRSRRGGAAATVKGEGQGVLSCRCRGGTSDHAAHSADERNARTAWLTGAKMLTVEVTVEHFLDAGEQDANGDWDYFYEGDLFTFSADTNSHGAILKARIYSDTPTRASFIEQRVKLETSPLTDEAVAYLRSRGATEIHCLGPVGYGVWSSAD